MVPRPRSGGISPQASTISWNENGNAAYFLATEKCDQIFGSANKMLNRTEFGGGSGTSGRRVSRPVDTTTCTSRWDRAADHELTFNPDRQMRGAPRVPVCWPGSIGNKSRSNKISDESIYEIENSILRCFVRGGLEKAMKNALRCLFSLITIIATIHLCDKHPSG